jgi:DNA-binding NtrC family response regulator
VQRAVAMSPPGGTIEPDHLSADLTAMPAGGGIGSLPVGPRPVGGRNLAAAVEEVEREVIGTMLRRTSGNISETARVLGLTRRGLYLKMRRLGLDGAAADT